jgi:hypothetical protein
MLKAIRTRIHLTPSTVIATLALIFAMTGGAYAASKYLITSTKQISPKVLKSLKGAKGVNGANGPAGAAGPAGPAGAAGAGTAGAAGPQGPAGPAGAKGETGTAGTNGTNGTTGFTETLPKEKTETGAWSYSTENELALVASISFPIPLEAPLAASQVHYVAKTGDGSTCPGTVQAPAAKPGNLCVYEKFAGEVEKEAGLAKAEIFPDSGVPPIEGGAAGAGTSGANIFFLAEGQLGGTNKREQRNGWGSWAVTAPE